MSYDATLEAPFGGEKRLFRLRNQEVEELQGLTGHGPEALVNRMLRGEAFIGEVRHTLRLGLIGYGMDADKAHSMVDRYCGPGSFMRNKPIAVDLLGKFLMEPEDSPDLGESQGETNRSPTDGGGSAGSTSSEASSG